MLQRFKDSNIKREREVFNCMLRNLFEEYRFFPQYPDKELHITACLFGGIIEKGLVTYMALGLALRYVLEALRKPFGSKMYYFGIAALDRFKNRYCFSSQHTIKISFGTYLTILSCAFVLNLSHSLPQTEGLSPVLSALGVNSPFPAVSTPFTRGNLDPFYFGRCLQHLSIISHSALVG